MINVKYRSNLWIYNNNNININYNNPKYILKNKYVNKKFMINHKN